METQETKMKLAALLAFSMKGVGDVLSAIDPKGSKAALLEAAGIEETAFDVYQQEVHPESVKTQVVTTERLDALRERFEASFGLMRRLEEEALASDQEGAGQSFVDGVRRSVRQDADDAIAFGKSQGWDVERAVTNVVAGISSAILEHDLRGYVSRSVLTTKMMMVAYIVRDEYAR